MTCHLGGHVLAGSHRTVPCGVQPAGWQLVGGLSQVLVGALVGGSCLFEPAFELVVVLFELGNVGFELEEAGVDRGGFNPHVKVFICFSALEVRDFLFDGLLQVGFDSGILSNEVLVWLCEVASELEVLEDQGSDPLSQGSGGCVEEVAPRTWDLRVLSVAMIVDLTLLMTTSPCALGRILAGGGTSVPRRGRHRRR